MLIRNTHIHFEFRAQSLEHLQGRGQLLFREEVDLQIEMSALVCLTDHSVLRHQNEQRQEDRFERHEERQKVEWKWIKRGDDRQVAGVHEDPRQKQDGVHDREWHAARQAVDKVAQPITRRPLMEGGALQVGDLADVAVRYLCVRNPMASFSAVHVLN